MLDYRRKKTRSLEVGSSAEPCCVALSGGMHFVGGRDWRKEGIQRLEIHPYNTSCLFNAIRHIPVVRAESCVLSLFLQLP
jgi:hypothetical protein